VKVLGIDPGTAVLGYGVVENGSGRHRLIECGTLTTNGRDPLPARRQPRRRDRSAPKTATSPAALT